MEQTRRYTCAKASWSVVMLVALCVGSACQAPQQSHVSPTESAPDESAPVAGAALTQAPKDVHFDTMEKCTTCHAAIVDQYQDSMHTHAYTNPVFQAQLQEFYQLRDVRRETYKDETPCLTCHSPALLLEARAAHAQTVSTQEDDGGCAACHDSERTKETGVTCDLCHRVEGYADDKPGNGNYLASPSPIKLGPFEAIDDHHREYSELHTKAEFCAICHESQNRYGLDIRTTYQEWRKSPQATRGIQCQDCHMSLGGFLNQGLASYVSGKAADMAVGSAPKRERLYSHDFEGGRSHAQVEGAVTLQVRPFTSPPEAGKISNLVIEVDNHRTGHCLPTGSAELRLVWLEVHVTVDGVEVASVPQTSDAVYGVTGVDDADRASLGPRVPDGQRIYRTVFTDADGVRTHRAFDAKQRLFDNRLQAGEIREESFFVSMPAGAKGKVVVEAALTYLAYPDGFAEALSLPLAEPITIASVRVEL